MSVDHSAEAERLRALHMAIASGDSVQRARFGEDEVSYYKADMAELKRLIAYHDGKCSGRRTRYAVSGKFRRPY